MFLGILTFVNMTAYLTVPALGFLSTSATVAFIGMSKQRSYFERLMTVLICTMPLYMIPAIPGTHFIFSWTSIFLVVLVGWSIGQIDRFGSLHLFLIITFVLMSLYTNFSMIRSFGAWYYLIQTLLFVLPASLLFEAKGKIGRQLGDDGYKRLEKTLIATIISLSLGVILQRILHVAGISIGNISYLGDRISYDWTVSAYSVLSSILAVGLAISPSLWRRGQKLTALVIASISGIAIVTNTSRTGLVAGLIVLLISAVLPLKFSLKKSAPILLLPAAGGAWWMLGSFTSSSRGLSLDQGIFDDNGRLETFSTAREILESDVLLALGGVGYERDERIPPHNFIIETFLSSGLIAGIAIFSLLGGLLLYLWGHEWQYPVWVILAGSLVYSGFYAVKPAVVIAALMIIFAEKEKRDSLALRGKPRTGFEAKCPARPGE